MCGSTGSCRGIEAACVRLVQHHACFIGITHVLAHDRTCSGVCRRVWGHMCGEGCVNGICTHSAVCASMLQRVATCTHVLQHVAACTCVLRHVAGSYMRVGVVHGSECPCMEHVTACRHGLRGVHVLQGEHACCRACTHVIACPRVAPQLQLHGAEAGAGCPPSTHGCPHTAADQALALRCGRGWCR